jgi:hypothetical protein
MVIAWCAQRAAAIQPFDQLTALSGVEGLDCHARLGRARNDRQGFVRRPSYAADFFGFAPLRLIFAMFFSTASR